MSLKAELPYMLVELFDDDRLLLSKPFASNGAITVFVPSGTTVTRVEVCTPWPQPSESLDPATDL